MKYFYLLPFILFITKLSAQDFPLWNELSDNDLKMTIYADDTTAAAVVLVNYGKTRFKIIGNAESYMYDYHYQIKILNKSAFDEADVKLKFTKRFVIQNLEAITHNWENGKKTSTPVTEFFETKISKTKREKSFAFPNVKVGSVIEYKFSVPRKYLISPREFHFQLHYPVKYSEFHFTFPYTLDYQVIIPKIPFEEKGDTVYFYYPDGYQPIGLTEYWWKAKNIPALKNEPYVSYIWDYRERMKMQLVRYRNPETGREKEFMSTWIKLAKYYREDDEAGKQYSKSKKIKTITTITDEFITPDLTKKEKLIQLFYFIQENIEWTEEYSLYTSNSFKDIYKQKEGSSADINLLLLALLKQYQIEASPMMISTRDNGYIIKSYPFLGQFNHVILVVTIDDEKYFLDATDPTYPYYVLPENSICQAGFLIGDSGHEWMNIKTHHSKQVAVIDMEVLANGTIKGIIKQQYKGYAAHATRKEIAKKGEEKYKTTYLDSRVSDFEITSIEFENIFDNKKPLEETITFIAKNAVQINDDFMYINPLLNFGESENPFKAEVRNLPIELPYLFSEQFIITLKLPEGYVIDELPESTRLKLLLDRGSFTFITNKDGQSIKMISKININNQYFKVDSYPSIKQFYTLIIEKQNEQIVLKKQL